MGRIPGRRVLIAVAGGVLVAVGAALMVLPGPGLLLVLAGVIVLAGEYAWARRLYHPVRKRAMQAAHASVVSSFRVACSVGAGLVLIAGGVMWIVVPALPLGGISTGSSLIVSGVLLLVALGYSYRRFRGSTASRRSVVVSSAARRNH